MKMHMAQQQKQVLTPQMIQNAGILQMNTYQLSEYVKEVVMENPMAELELEYDSRGEDDNPRAQKQEWLNQMSWHSNSYYGKETDNDGQDYMKTVAKKTENSLKEVLLQQLYAGGYSKMQFEIFKTIADNLDSNGFFKMDITEFSSIFNYEEEESRKCLTIMQNLEPYGVCSADLKTCLLKQMEKDDRDDSIFDIARMIVKYHLVLLAKNQLRSLARELGCPLEKVKEAATFIKTLNPRPSQGYDDARETVYVVPDITIIRVNDKYEAFLNNESCPVIYVRKEYRELLKNCPDEDVKKYLIEKTDQIYQIQQGIQNRENTLTRLGKYLAERQQAFFAEGPISLKTVMMKEVAESLDLHESTVSRAVKDKYLQCRWGTFPLSYFFSKGGVKQNIIKNQRNASMTRVQELLRQIIEDEDKKKPYSDQQLSEILQKQGIDISRRTVTKYRENMGIVSGRGRKEF